MLVSRPSAMPSTYVTTVATGLSSRPTASSAAPENAPLAAEMPIDTSSVAPRPSRMTTSLAFLTRKLPSVTLWCQTARTASRRASTQPSPEYSRPSRPSSPASAGRAVGAQDVAELELVGEPGGVRVDLLDDGVDGVRPEGVRQHGRRQREDREERQEAEERDGRGLPVAGVGLVAAERADEVVEGRPLLAQLREPFLGGRHGASRTPVPPGARAL